MQDCKLHLDISLLSGAGNIIVKLSETAAYIVVISDVLK